MSDAYWAEYLNRVTANACMKIADDRVLLRLRGWETQCTLNLNACGSDDEYDDVAEARSVGRSETMHHPGRSPCPAGYEYRLVLVVMTIYNVFLFNRQTQSQRATEQYELN